MRFSVFFFSSLSDTESDYRLLFDVVRYADANGFDAVWMPERHFRPVGGLFPNPAISSAALAMITKRLELRAGSVVSPLHNILNIVEDWAMVDRISKGRTAISFGSGWNPDDFVLCPDHYPNRVEIMLKQIEVLRRLWRGESVRLANGHGLEIDVRCYPQPIRPEPKVWLSSGGNPETFKTAGKIGANVLTHLLSQGPEDLGRAIHDYRTERGKAGYGAESGQVAVMLHTYVGENAKEASDTAIGPLRHYLREWLETGHRARKQRSSLDEIPTDLQNEMIELRANQLLNGLALVGNVAHCRASLEKLTELGVNEVASFIDFGISYDKALEGLRRLAALVRNNHS